jgi:hypothetical protein
MSSYGLISNLLYDSSLITGVFGLAFVVEVVVGYNPFMHKTQP